MFKRWAILGNIRGHRWISGASRGVQEGSKRTTWSRPPLLFHCSFCLREHQALFATFGLLSSHFARRRDDGLPNPVLERFGPHPVD